MTGPWLKVVTDHLLDSFPSQPKFHIYIFSLVFDGPDRLRMVRILTCYEHNENLITWDVLKLNIILWMTRSSLVDTWITTWRMYDVCILDDDMLIFNSFSNSLRINNIVLSSIVLDPHSDVLSWFSLQLCPNFLLNKFLETLITMYKFNMARLIFISIVPGLRRCDNLLPVLLKALSGSEGLYSSHLETSGLCHLAP